MDIPNFSDNFETGKIITKAYRTLEEKGIKMPNDVQLMIPEEEGILGFRPYALKGKEFETPILFNRDLSKKNIKVASIVTDNLKAQMKAVDHSSESCFQNKSTIPQVIPAYGCTLRKTACGKPPHRGHRRDKSYRFRWHL